MRLLGVEGVWADRPALNPVILGTLQGDGYVIEKIRYESFPQFYVSANLYIPNDTAFPLPRPAVLCPHGHWGDGGKGSLNVYVRSIGLVKQGYVVLAFDGVGYGNRMHPRFSDQGHEDFSSLQSVMGGPRVMGVQTYEISRAADYLADRPDVADISHLAITAASGGASQTLYALALDPRIEVGVPVIYDSFGLSSDLGCSCESLPFLHASIDHPMLYGLIYPKKVLFLDNKDTTLTHMNAAFGLYKRSGHPEWMEFSRIENGPHRYAREYRGAMYAWLSRWVLGKEAGSFIDDPEGVSDTMPLRDWGELFVDLPKDGLTFFELCVRNRKHLPPLRLPATPLEFEVALASIRKNVGALLDLDNQRPPVEVRVIEEPGAYRIRILPEVRPVLLNVQEQSGELYSWEGWMEARLHQPDAPAPWPCVVLYSPNEYPGKDHAYQAMIEPIDEGGVISALLDNGYAVLDVKPRFNVIPEWFSKREPRSRYESAATKKLNWSGTPVFGRHVADVGHVLDVLEQLDRIDSNKITLWGMGEGGLIAIAGSAFDPRVCQVVVQESRLHFGVELSDRHPAWSYPPNLLQYAELDPIAAMLAPRTLLVANAVDDDRQPLTIEQIQDELTWTLHRYANANETDNLRLMTEAGPDAMAEAMTKSCGPR